jgi:hypothetical protein
MNVQQTANQLPAPKNAIDYRTFTRGALIYQVYREEDPDTSPGSEISENHYEAWQADAWGYVGVVVEIRIKSEMNWAIPHKVGSASLWGIESDSGADYFAQVEAELIAEAEEDVRLTFNALKYAMPQIG